MTTITLNLPDSIAIQLKSEANATGLQLEDYALLRLSQPSQSDENASTAQKSAWIDEIISDNLDALKRLA